MFKRLTPKKIGLLEWNSGTLDMSFVDTHPKDVKALLDEQVKSCEKQLMEWMIELENEIIRHIKPDNAGNMILEPQYLKLLKEKWQDLRDRLKEYK